MSNDICPCKGCEAPKRYPGCGGKCGEYKSWKERHLLRKAACDATKLCERICDDYAIKESTKSEKTRRTVEKHR